MEIALLTLGTRGDVQPYAELGRALIQRGHKATLASGGNFESLSRDYAVPFVPVKADFQALVNSEEGRAMMKNPFLAKKHFKTIIQPMMVEAMREFYKLAKSVDCVLYHVKSLADYFADQMPGKMIKANVVPAIEPTSAFPNPVFSAFGLPHFLNRFTYKLADLGLAMMNDAIREFRVSNSLTKSFPRKLNCPSIYGVSPKFLPIPDDYPENSFFSGFWQSKSRMQLPAEISNFLSAGKKSILITFGSMPFETTFDLRESLRNISVQLNVNIVIVKGWGFGESSSLDSDSIKVIDSAPYDKLIPLVDAVIFHGGIGTMSACLQAGTPFLACPVMYPMGDQHFWGQRAFALGCAPKPVPLKKLSGDILRNKISELLAVKSYRENCQRMSALLSQEDGLANAVNFVEAKIQNRASANN
jgi:sterol 3beta-glucosyltransferase